MSVARSFLLLSAGMIAGGLSMMTMDADIDWLRYVRPARVSTITPPTTAEVPPPAPVPEPAPAAPTARSAPPVPITVIVNQPSNQPSASTPIAMKPWQGTGRQISLAQELQTELRRVGCYGGAIDGVWTPLSQRSARAFAEGVNANLPVGEPDHALLALAKAAQGAVCAKPCPPEVRPGADTVCKPAKSAPETASAALVRSTPTPGATTASGVSPSSQSAPVQPAAAAPDIVTAATPPRATAANRSKTAAQQKPGQAFDLFRWLGKSLY
jgi:hypothetical protein